VRVFGDLDAALLLTVTKRISKLVVTITVTKHDYISESESESLFPKKNTNGIESQQILQDFSLGSHDYR
jgi:hypothetical protein